MKSEDVAEREMLRDFSRVEVARLAKGGTFANKNILPE